MMIHRLCSFNLFESIHRHIYFQQCTPEEEERYVNEVHRFMSDKPYAAHMYGKVFTISNRDRITNDVQELRYAIEHLAQGQSYEVPLVWFKFKELLKETRMAWLLWSSIKAIGEEAGIQDENTLKAALKFLHEVGDVYFDANLTSDFVVTDPQWLIEQFRLVISIPSFLTQQRFPDSTRHWLNLEKQGVLHKVVITNVWPAGAVDGLIAIMKRFALLVSVPRNYSLQYVQRQHDEGEIFLVPSLLPAKSEEDKPPESTEPPVMIIPPDNFIPVGMVSKLIASLVNENHWNVVGPLYKDAATFSPQGADSKVTVTLTQRQGMIEVTGNQLEPNTGHLLRQALKTIVGKLHKFVGHKPFTAGIYCSKCHTMIEVELHGLTLKPYYICPGHRGKYEPSNYAAWFNLSEPSLVNDDRIYT